MPQKEKKSKDDSLKEIILSDDSNLILPEVSFPSSYEAQSHEEVKYGAKYRASTSEHDLLVYQQRLSRKESTLTPEEIRNLVSETTQRRITLEESIRQQKEQYMQRHELELQARFTKEREEAHQERIAHENETQREIRISAEEEIKTQRAKQLQALENKSRKEKEQAIVFFEQSSNKFNEKYGNPLLRVKVSGETGIDRIISSRPFTDDRYAHRCCLCGYHFQESLTISKIYQHIYENKDSHMKYVLSEIDAYYNTQIIETRRKHAAEDNPDEKQKRISKDIEQLQKLKGAKYL